MKENLRNRSNNYQNNLLDKRLLTMLPLVIVVLVVMAAVDKNSPMLKIN